MFGKDDEGINSKFYIAVLIGCLESYECVPDSRPIWLKSIMVMIPLPKGKACLAEARHAEGEAVRPPDTW